MEEAKLTVRIDRAQLAELQEAAREDNRSVNAQVLYFIRRGLDTKQGQERAQ